MAKNVRAGCWLRVIRDQTLLEGRNRCQSPSYAYDALSHLLNVLHKNSGGTTLDGATYTYDNAGNRLTKANSLNGVTEGYKYDPIYELTQVVQGTTTTETYGHDFVGNRLSSLGVPTYNYNSSNELTSNTTGGYTYDNNGNTLTDPSGKSYTWDYENRLISAIVPGTGTVTFKYDPFGRRIQKSSPSGTTNYLYDGPNLVEELDSAGNLLARYTQGNAGDAPLGMFRSGVASYYETDALSSVSSLSNSSQALSNTYTYNSFGKLTTSTGSTTNSFQYTGREFDQETGIYNYRARYYDASIGRFDSEDPLRVNATIDFYPYVLNDPVRWRDPNGRKIDWGSIYNTYENARNYSDLIVCATRTYFCLHNLASNVSSVRQNSAASPCPASVLPPTASAVHSLPGVV